MHQPAQGTAASQIQILGETRGRQELGGESRAGMTGIPVGQSYLEPADLWHRWLCRWGQQLFLKNGTTNFMWCPIDSSDQQGKEAEDLRSNSTEVPSSQDFGFPRACQVGGCTARLWNPFSGSLEANSSFKIIVKKCSPICSFICDLIMISEGWFNFHLDVCKCQNTLQSGQHSCVW